MERNDRRSANGRNDRSLDLQEQVIQKITTPRLSA